MSGGYNYADAYSKYKKGTNSNSDFEKYVDSQGDLKSAWARIKSDPTHPDSDYWIKRGATSKAAFGRAHAAEDSALYSGTYQGGTDYTKGSDAWKDLFKGRTNTRFDEWNENKGKKKDDTETPTGPIKHDNPYFPMLTQDYSSPASQDWSSYLGGNKGLLFQPWTSDYQAAAGIPNNLWNYAPPEGIDYAVRYTNPLTGKLDMNLMPAKDAKTGGDKTGAKKGSDKAKDLAAGKTHHPQMYDENDMWIGAEGNSYDAMGYEIDNKTGKRTGAKINDSFGIGNKIMGLMGAWPVEVQHAKNAFNAGLTADQKGAMAAAKAAQAGTGFADMYGGGENDPTSSGFVEWDGT